MIEILLATYNGSEYLAEQIDSLFAQSVEDWILLVHDDGSSDQTCKIVREFQKKHPKKIYFFEDGVETGGAKNNFSHLISYSKSNYVMFCDQDDVWLPHKIEKTYSKMKECEILFPGKPILIHTDLKVVGKNLDLIATSMFDYQKLTKTPSFDELLIQNNVTGCTCMVNRKALNKSMPIPDAALMHDWWLALTVVNQFGCICFLNESTILYRQHGSNAAGAKKINATYFWRKSMKLMSFVSNIYKVKKQADCLKTVCIIKIISYKVYLTFIRVCRGILWT